jgi:hypothetical protein
MAESESVMKPRYLGGINLNKVSEREAQDMAKSLLTALKLGFVIEASIPNLRDSQKLEYWTPLIQFRAVPPAVSSLNTVSGEATK